MHLRPFRNDDVAGAIAVFRDTILHIASQDYDADQLRVWTQHADDVEGFRTRLSAGVSIVAVDEQGLVAFGQLYPADHINYLYCRQRGRGKGYAASILSHLETAATRPGVRVLYTEASLTARRFFERHGYTVVGDEVVVRHDVTLHRFKMQKSLVRET